jgi:tetratricopeptide (TPR) repeat protein
LLHAQDESLSERADSLYQNQVWASAADAYAALSENDPTNGRNWFRLGVSWRSLARFDDAELALRKALELGFPPKPHVAFELARVSAGHGSADSAYAWLQRAVNSGYANVAALKDASELQGFQNEARFLSIVKTADSLARPCEYDPRRREFDFWVGTWEVRGAQGQLFGTNTIRKEENGCLLVENWTGGGGGTGTSINYYDPGDDAWVQDWVSSNATLIHIEGGLEEGSMRLTGDILSGTGDRLPFRGIWTPLSDGGVRQFFEQSYDGGETWSPWFEGFYSPTNTDTDSSP